MTTTQLKATAELQHLRGLRKQLGDIELSLRMRRGGGLGPRSYRATLAAIAVVVIAYSATFLATKVGAKVPSGVLWIAFALALLVMWLVNTYSTAPRTYTEKIVALMRAYDPVDVEAYLELQRRGPRFDMEESDILHQWIQRERRAVHVALQRCSAHSLASAAIDRARG